jgi:hypothetical protein
VKAGRAARGGCVEVVVAAVAVVVSGKFARQTRLRAMQM